MSIFWNRREVIYLGRVALGEEQKKMYKILDLKGWVEKQRKLNKKTLEEVADALGISTGRLSQMLKVPEPKDRMKKKKGGKFQVDEFSYGQVLILCKYFEVDEKEKERLLTF